MKRKPERPSPLAAKDRRAVQIPAIGPHPPRVGVLIYWPVKGSGGGPKAKVQLSSGAVISVRCGLVELVDSVRGEPT